VIVSDCFPRELTTEMSNRENFSESSFYPLESENRGEWLGGSGGQEHHAARYHLPPGEHNDDRSLSFDHSGKYKAVSCESSLIFITNISIYLHDKGGVTTTLFSF